VGEHLGRGAALRSHKTICRGKTGRVGVDQERKEVLSNIFGRGESFFRPGNRRLIQSKGKKQEGTPRKRDYTSVLTLRNPNVRVS